MLSATSNSPSGYERQGSTPRIGDHPDVIGIQNYRPSHYGWYRWRYSTRCGKSALPWFRTPSIKFSPFDSDRGFYNCQIRRAS